MSNNLFKTTAFALFSLLWAWLAYKGGSFLRREQHYVKDSRLIDYLGFSRRSFDFEGWAIAILSGIGLAPFFPVIMAFVCWHEREACIFNWVGWASISIVGFLSLLRGLILGKIYLERYWEAVDSVKIEELIPKSAEFSHTEFSKFQEHVLDLVFRGVDSTIALAAAKEGWRYG